MCQPKLDYDNTNPDRIRDGLATTNQGYIQLANNNEDQTSFSKRKQTDVNLNLALQETWQSYDNCANRERNAGLFTADQVLRNNRLGYSSAVYTRQNPNGLFIFTIIQVWARITYI